MRKGSVIGNDDNFHYFNGLDRQRSLLGYLLSNNS